LVTPVAAETQTLRSASVAIARSISLCLALPLETFWT
jgi:hypothetical protein